MKKIFLASWLMLMIFFFFLNFSGTAAANLLELSPRLQLYNPPETRHSFTWMYGLGAKLNLTPNLSFLSTIDYTSYGTAGHTYSLMPVTGDVIYYLLPGQNLNPFLGAGVGFFKKTIDGANKYSAGGQMKAGADLKIFFMVLCLEARYVMPDFTDFSLNSFAYGLSFGGLVYIPL